MELFWLYPVCLPPHCLRRLKGCAEGLNAGLDREVQELVADLQLEAAHNLRVHLRGDAHVLAAGLLLEDVGDERQLLRVERGRRRDDGVGLAALGLHELHVRVGDLARVAHPVVARHGDHQVLGDRGDFLALALARDSEHFFDGSHLAVAAHGRVVQVFLELRLVLEHLCT